MDLTLIGITKFLTFFGYEVAKIGFPVAIALYQKFHKLPITEAADEATLAHMCNRRCWHPDLSKAEAQTLKWGKNHLTWKFLNYEPMGLTQPEISDSVTKALDLWSAVTPLTFQEVFADDQSDITLSFDIIDGPSLILAQTYFPPVGTMSIDQNESWSWKLPIGRGAVDLTTVIAHEAGHLIGLEHTNVQGSQMLPVYAGPMRFLGPNDIQRAQALYGPKS